MKNKIFLILLAAIIFAGGVLSARVFTGGGEDAWICENGVWVRHGNPVSPAPDEGCGQDNTTELTYDQDQTLGGDRDEYGCIGSAGYTWCEAKEKCLRVWEEPCVAAGVDMEAIAAAVKTQLVTKHGQLAENMTVSVNRVDGDFAEGGARDQAAVGGGMWFAAYTGGTWKLVWDGNGTISCSDIAGYAFPAEMIPECYDEASGRMEKR